MGGTAADHLSRGIHRPHPDVRPERRTRGDRDLGLEPLPRRACDLDSGCLIRPRHEEPRCDLGGAVPRGEDARRAAVFNQLRIRGSGGARRPRQYVRPVARPGCEGRLVQQGSVAIVLRVARRAACAPRIPTSNVEMSGPGLGSMVSIFSDLALAHSDRYLWLNPPRPCAQVLVCETKGTDVVTYG